MTTYSAIANSEIAVGAPITNSLMTKIRDNPLAIQENDGSAPTIAYATSAGSATTATTATTANSVASASVTSAGIDWSNFPAHQESYGSFGLTLYPSPLDGGTEGTAWRPFAFHRVYIDSNQSSILGVARVHKASGGSNMEWRLAIGATVSSAASVASTTYVETSELTLDISALSGWQSLEIQYRCTGAIPGTDEAYMDSYQWRIS